MISYQFLDTPTLPLKKRLISNWLKKIINDYSKKLGDINLVFCDDKQILSHNQKFLNHDYYTDIITFDYCDGEIISGDLLISIDTVRSNSFKLNTDFKTELARVICHGVFHLLGFGDKKPQEILKIRELENGALMALSDSII